VQSPTEVPKENLHSVVSVLPLYLLHSVWNSFSKQPFMWFTPMLQLAAHLYFFWFKLLDIMNANYMPMFDCKYLSILDILNIWQNSWSNSIIVVIIGWLSNLFLA
jgi:hypothetical protein